MHLLKTENCQVCDRSFWYAPIATHRCGFSNHLAPCAHLICGRQTATTRVECLNARVCTFDSVLSLCVSVNAAIRLDFSN